MSPSPAQLRASAAGLRSIAAAVTDDFDGLVHHGGPSTWTGPAATAHQTAARAQRFRVECAADQLRRVATRLDDEAAGAELRHRQEEGGR